MFGVIILFNLALENGFLRGRGVGKLLDLLLESVRGRFWSRVWSRIYWCMELYAVLEGFDGLQRWS